MKVAAALAILCLVTVFDRCTAAFYPCSTCVGGNCEEPEDCPHGIAMDICGRKVCAKGPGQRCGGKWDLLGHCGDGMFCSRCDNRCGGCSLATLECYTPKCV